MLNAGEVPPPSVLNISVLGIVAGSSPIAVSVMGMDFMNGAQVLWNGEDRLTQFVDANTLTMTLSAADFVVPGPANVSVRNPEAFGRESKVASFGVVGADLNQVFLTYLPLMRR